MKEKYDAIVIGTGIIGSSITYHLVEKGFNGDILVVDKNEAIAEGSTALSAGAFRNIWGTKINIEMTNYSIEVFKHFEEKFGISIGLHQHGYLFTFYREPWERVIKNKNIWEENGVRIVLLEPHEIENKVPGLKTSVKDMDPEVVEFLGIEDIVGGIFGPDCGSFDPTAVTKGYFEKAKEMGNVDILLKSEVKRIIIENNRVHGVELVNGTKVESELVILSAGAWSRGILERSGVEEEKNIPVQPVKRMLFITNLPPIEGFDKIPLTIIDKGIYFKIETGNLMVGRAKEDQAPGFDLEPELSYYTDEINVYMQERIPGTEYCQVKSMWAGLYAITEPDHNAIIGFHPDIKGLFICTGFSGHGAMTAPAAGMGSAELIINGKYESIDLSPLRFERFRDNELLVESIVI